MAKATKCSPASVSAKRSWSRVGRRKRAIQEAPFHHPASRQQDKAVLGCRQFDNFQSDAVRLGIGGRLLTGIALVHKGHLDRPPVAA